jgi:DNA-binding MarR family transcriptional regulator
MGEQAFLPRPVEPGTPSADNLRDYAQGLLALADAMDAGTTGEIHSEIRRQLGPGCASEINLHRTATRARRLYTMRRARRLPPDLLGEPAWDMLLDLMVHYARDRQVSITSAAIASGVPPTTALRWIASLEDHGLVERRQSDLDKRVSYVRLSRKGFLAMDASLNGCE